MRPQLLLQSYSMKVLIFDFDGVIVESSQIKHDCFLHAASKLGGDKIRSELDLALRTKLVGAERSRVADWFVKKTEGRVHKETYLQEFVSQLKSLEAKICLVPGFLDFFKKQVVNAKAAIVSAAPKSDILRILDLQGVSPHLFTSIQGSEDGTKVEGIRKVLQELQVPSQDCVFYGDMPSDYEAAKECGVPFVRVESAMGRHCVWTEGVVCIKAYD